MTAGFEALTRGEGLGVDIARGLRVIAAQFDAGRRLAREVGQSHQPGHTKSCRWCTALIDCQTSGLWAPDAKETT